MRRHSTAKPNSKPSRTFTIYMVVWSSNNITSTITAKNTNYYAIVKNDVFVAKNCNYALDESSEGLFCAPRKLANFCHPVVFRDPIPMIETQSSPTYTISYRFQHSKPLKGDLKETKVDPQDGRGWKYPRFILWCRFHDNWFINDYCREFALAYEWVEGALLRQRREGGGNPGNEILLRQVRVATLKIYSWTWAFQGRQKPHWWWHK